MAEEKIDISVDRRANGLVLTTVHKDVYIKRMYIGYTVKEAKEIFCEEVKQELINRRGITNENVN